MADGKIYIGNEDGEMVVLKEGNEAKVIATNLMPRAIFGTAAAANGVLYFADTMRLYAVRQGK